MKIQLIIDKLYNDWGTGVENRPNSGNRDGPVYLRTKPIPVPDEGVGVFNLNYSKGVISLIKAFNLII